MAEKVRQRRRRKEQNHESEVKKQQQLRREYKEFVDKEANLGDVRRVMISGKRKGEKENQETAINK